jgi:small nuclear ribonucleoprotein (snRNP)-like protein
MGKMMKLERENLKKFLDRQVKLVKKNGFVLYGVITAIYEDFIEFNTSQATSLISLDFVKEIVLINRGENIDN